MAKAYGINGVAVGKLGNSVYSVNSGVQIVRAYQPVVANPNTSAQQSNRAKLKLASQLAATLAPTIAIVKEGLVSRRNHFIRRNYEFISANEGEAQISLENIQLTNGTLSLPGIEVVRDQVANRLEVQLQNEAGESIDAVVYCFYKKLEDGSLQYYTSQTVTPGNTTNDDAPTTFGLRRDYIDGEILILAYGIRYNGGSAASRVKYENLKSLSGVDIATLVYNQTLSSSDFTFSQTRGVQLAAGQNSAEGATTTQIRVYATPSPSNGGSITGSGLYDRGSEVTLRATPASNFTFDGWRRNGSAEFISTANPYVITNLQNTQDLIAVFSSGGEEIPLTPQD